MEKWIKHTYVCTTCDALIEYTIDTDKVSYVYLINLACVCGGQANKLSEVDATIKPTLEKEEEQTMETATTTYLETQIAELQDIISRQNSALTTHQNCDYWKSENGRVQGQLIDVIDEIYAGNWTDVDDVANTLCQIIDYTPVKTIEFTATMKFTGRIEVPANEADNFDLEQALEDAYVDINNGDVVIDGYELYDAEEC